MTLTFLQTNKNSAKLFKSDNFLIFFNWFLNGIDRFCHKFWFSNLYTFAAQCHYPLIFLTQCHYPLIFLTQCHYPLIFLTMNSVRWNSLGLKYQRFRSSGCKHIGIRKFEFVAKKSIPFRNAYSEVKLALL